MLKKKILNKTCLIIIFISFALLLPLITECSLEKVNRLSNMKANELDPKWDLELEVKVLEKSENLKEKVGNIDPAPYTTNAAGIPIWPVNDIEYQNLSGSEPIDVDIDLNGDGINDLDIYGIRSEMASLFINVWLEDNSSSITDIQISDITFNSVEIEGESYDVEIYFFENNIIKYRVIDFPHSNNDYYIDFEKIAPRENINFDDLIITLNPGTQSLPNGPFDLYLETEFSIGDNFGVVAKFTPEADDTPIFEKEDIPIPLSDLPFGEIDKFKLKYIFESPLPFNLSMTNTIKKEDDPTAQEEIFIIQSGNLKEHMLNGYFYVDQSSTTNNDLIFDKNLFDESSLDMDYSITIVNDDKKILIENDGIFTIKGEIECHGEMDF